MADLLGVDEAGYTASQMTYDLRRLRLKGLVFRPPRTNRYLVTPYGWKVARLFSLSMLVFFDQLSPCSPPMMRYCRFLYARPSTKSMHSLTHSSTNRSRRKRLPDVPQKTKTFVKMLFGIDV